MGRSDGVLSHLRCIQQTGLGAGSVAPKVEAALAFVTSGAADSSGAPGRCAIITSADRLGDAVRPEKANVSRIVAL